MSQSSEPPTLTPEESIVVTPKESTVVTPEESTVITPEESTVVTPEESPVFTPEELEQHVRRSVFTLFEVFQQEVFFRMSSKEQIEYIKQWTLGNSQSKNPSVFKGPPAESLNDPFSLSFNHPFFCPPSSHEIDLSSTRHAAAAPSSSALPAAAPRLPPLEQLMDTEYEDLFEEGGKFIVTGVEVVEDSNRVKRRVYTVLHPSIALEYLVEAEKLAEMIWNQ